MSLFDHHTGGSSLSAAIASTVWCGFGGKNQRVQAIHSYFSRSRGGTRAPLWKGFEPQSTLPARQPLRVVERCAWVAHQRSTPPTTARTRGTSAAFQAIQRRCGAVGRSCFFAVAGLRACVHQRRHISGRVHHGVGSAAQGIGPRGRGGPRSAHTSSVGSYPFALQAARPVSARMLQHPSWTGNRCSQGCPK